MTKFSLLLLTLLILFAGCGEKSFVINGTLIDATPGTTVYLDRLGSTNLDKLDSIVVDESGKFKLKYSATTPAFYLLRTSGESFISTMIEPGEQITLTAKADSLAFPIELIGSPGTQLMIDYNLRLQEALAQLGELNNVYQENINSDDLESVMADLDNKAQSIIADMNLYTREYIDNNLPSLVCLIALYQQIVPEVYVLNPQEDIEYFKKVDSTLFALYPEYEPVSFLHEQVATLIGTMSPQDSEETPPEITLPDPTGTEVSLSSTRGSVVLLDFWAGWCPPCRAENPNLVKAYDKFHDKGFEIFQVSLDQDRDVWLDAIEDDKLGRWYHVSDLLYWKSEVVSLYGIESIPTNYLLDRDGKVIASNLRGEALNEKLEEIFN
jgi:thiol-disulfide isomerase/thioredoxin